MAAERDGAPAAPSRYRGRSALWSGSLALSRCAAPGHARPTNGAVPRAAPFLERVVSRQPRRPPTPRPARARSAASVPTACGPAPAPRDRPVRPDARTRPVAHAWPTWRPRRPTTRAGGTTVAGSARRHPRRGLPRPSHLGHPIDGYPSGIKRGRGLPSQRANITHNPSKAGTFHLLGTHSMAWHGMASVNIVHTAQPSTLRHARVISPP